MGHLPQTVDDAFAAFEGQDQFTIEFERDTRMMDFALPFTIGYASQFDYGVTDINAVDNTITVTKTTEYDNE